MEKSAKSCMSKVVSDDDDDQESGWTVYFDELFKNESNEENTSFSSSAGLESSLISDAASSFVKKAAADHHQPFDRILSSKKRKTKVVDHLVDNDLEDTASSPVNSPKIYSMMNQFDRKLAETKYIMDISQEKGRNSAQPDGRSSLGKEINNNNDNESELRKRGLCLVPLSNNDNESELRKRGLCLVPLSMLVNYL